ncbi:MAG: SAM-dependent methyltransferase [Thermodesulfovibrionales bacterium]|nr:SAM-dependent methyltransferase [Thermodesulfovibrionales bacterium]
MNTLEQKIIEKIRKEGPITFETFMEMALYEPWLGYYASDKTEIGRVGDFYTSPHLHPAFGAMIGKQIEEMWEVMGNPPEADDFHVIEIGAGAGYMCKDILDYLTKRDFFNSLTYVIVEHSPFMQHKQEKLLEGFLHRVKWCSSLKEVGSIRGCILSNELLDAFPVHLVEMEDELREIYVSVDKDTLVETKGNLNTDAIADYLNEFSIELKKGYRTEINLRIKDWLRSVDEVLSEGFILAIDYGYPAQDYYSDDRNRGTLFCYYKHQMNEDPYKNIGEQDITSHVNFSSVKKWGEDIGLKTLGFCQQGAFLIALGIVEMVKERYGNTPDYLFEVAKIKGLILPGTMGETHKVIVQYKGRGSPELRGFSIRNQVDRL